MSEMMMATTMADDVPRYARAAIESLAPEDFETASIRSAAPSYILPAYTPQPAQTRGPNNRSVSSLLDVEPSPPLLLLRKPPLWPPAHPHRAPRNAQQPDLPPLPVPRPRLVPSASGHHNNPTARLYQNVALRRASAASSSSSSSSSSSRNNGLDVLMRRVMLERIEEEERMHRERMRPLEDPHLVGEEAARQARQERIARERGGGGNDVLVREDRRWDWFLSQLKDQEERERGWRRFRRDMDRRSSGRLGFRIGARS
ncbi:hypothetical protein N0V88_003674 [Collariella sp. IMI 366227]|nr:hypothetical protein N0V88_003674 [Collariella sp. IMI 366227]